MNALSRALCHDGVLHGHYRPVEGFEPHDVPLKAHVVEVHEEGVLTIYGLAFAPTARLFFNSTHSLQRICDWQDQALLLAYMGPVRTKALFDQLGIRGAIDLQALAVLALAAGKTPEDDLVPVPPATKGKYSQLTAALSKPLGPEGAALLALLYTVNTDDVVLRLRVHWKSTAEATQQ